MSIKPILTVPNDKLSQVSESVDLNKENITQLIQELVDTLDAQHDPPGVGLSAPQIGVHKRVFLARPEPGMTPTVFINPVITQRASKTTTKKDNRTNLEGCLSIPKLYGEVQRSQWIEITYYTFNEQKELVQQTEHADNFYARVIQHEQDHLDGILFTQRVLEQGGTMYQVELEDGQEVLVPVEL